MFVQDNQKIQEALARLISQYQGSPKLKSLIAAFVQPLQDAEAALTVMNNARYLPNAQGAQLDLIGAIVGIPRPPGASDAVYLNDIYGQIKINTSQGQPEQVIQTFQLFTGATLVILTECFPAEILISSDYVPTSQADVDQLLKILGEVAPAGVRPDGIIAFDSTEAFAFDGTLPGLGFGSVYDPTAGGKLPLLFLRNTYFEFAGDDVHGAGLGSVQDPLVGGLLT